MGSSIGRQHVPFSVAFFLTLLSSTSSAQQPKVLAPHYPIPQLDRQKVDWSKQATQRSMIGGLWMTDANFKSSIYLRNVVETDPITVTPILWLANGTNYRLPPVTVEAAGTAIIDINAGLQSMGISSWATLSGYVELQYAWPWDPFCATVRDVDVAHSVIFTYGLRAAAPLNPQAVPPLPGAQTIEGMWWKETPTVSGFVALSNVTSAPIQASLQVTDSLASSLAQHTVTISPHGTKVVDLTELPQITNTAGGLRITYVGAPDVLILNGGVEDESVGYSAVLPFASRPLAPSELPAYATAASFTGIAELGLMVGAADPMMNFPANTTFKPYSVLRNVSNSPFTVTPVIWWMQNGAPQSARLPPLQLQPFESRSLDVLAMLATAGLANFNGSFNMVFEGNMQGGSLIPAAGSVDQTKTYVFEVTPRAISESASKSLQYWSIGNGDDTMVTIWNAADEAQDLVLKLFFSGGHYLVPIHLEPRVTRSINISQIAASSIPDAEGNIIPVSVHEGSAKITGSGADNEMILVAIDSGIYNVRKATCAQNCTTCDGYTAWAVQLNPFGVGVGSQYTVLLTAAYDGGSRVNFSGNWSSSNTGVATVGSTTGTVTGVSAGSVQIGGSVSNIMSAPVYGQNCAPYNPCPMGYGGGGGGSGNVGSLSCSPSSLVRGSSVTCTASGASGSTFSNWKFSDGTNTVNGSGTSSTWSGIMVASGTVSVTVTSNGQGTTVSAQVTVNPRSWHTLAAGAASVPNGTFYSLPVPPQNSGTDSGLGKFNEQTSNSAGPNSTVINGGPNNGYAYFASQISISVLFQYEINPDLQSSTSQFSTHQWGACGFISWSNLLTQTNRHEYNSSTQSHYAFYTNSINSGANNPGDFFEQQVAAPGADLNQFANTTLSGLNSRYAQIAAATSIEPFPVNDSETGTFLGNINYAPYTSCP
jgi:hypothetical protein